MGEGHISLAYSVDADDAFMFHAVREERIDTGGLSFSHRRGDTAELNRLALHGAADVVAISLAAYPQVAERYQLLPHGASVGRGYGPVVVAKAPMEPGDLAGRRVGVPGLTTTAWLVLGLIEPRVVPVVIPIVPFGRVFDALERDEIDAALLIHEGRLLFRDRGLHEVLDEGRWWQNETGLPLVLGVNVIRRELGAVAVARISTVLRRAIEWAMENRDEVIRAASGEDRGERGLADAKLVDRYLGMYANADTLELPEDARRGVEELFRRARAAGLPAPHAVDWAP